MEAKFQDEVAALEKALSAMSEERASLQTVLNERNSQISLLRNKVSTHSRTFAFTLVRWIHMSLVSNPSSSKLPISFQRLRVTQLQLRHRKKRCRRNLGMLRSIWWSTRMLCYWLWLTRGLVQSLLNQQNPIWVTQRRKSLERSDEVIHSVQARTSRVRTQRTWHSVSGAWLVTSFHFLICLGVMLFRNDALKNS